MLMSHLKVLKFDIKSVVFYVFDPADFEVYLHVELKITIERVIVKLEISFENLKNRALYVQK